jgi:hypothetical protein
MCEWLGLHLDFEPERPELPLRAPVALDDQVVVVRQYRPAVADRRWLDVGGTLVRASYSAAPARRSEEHAVGAVPARRIGIGVVRHDRTGAVVHDSDPTGVLDRHEAEPPGP